MGEWEVWRDQSQSAPQAITVISIINITFIATIIITMASWALAASPVSEMLGQPNQR